MCMHIHASILHTDSRAGRYQKRRRYDIHFEFHNITKYYDIIVITQFVGQKSDKMQM